MVTRLDEILEVISNAGVAYRTAIRNAVREDDNLWPSAGENDIAERNITFWIVHELMKHDPSLQPIFEFSVSSCDASGRIDCMLHSSQSAILIESKLLYHYGLKASSLAADVRRMRDCTHMIAERFQSSSCIGIASGSMWINPEDERKLMVETRPSILRWFQEKDHEPLEQIRHLSEQILEIESRRIGVRFAKRACTWKSEQQWLLGVIWIADIEANQSRPRDV